MMSLQKEDSRRKVKFIYAKVWPGYELPWLFYLTYAVIIDMIPKLYCIPIVGEIIMVLIPDIANLGHSLYRTRNTKLVRDIPVWLSGH